MILPHSTRALLGPDFVGMASRYVVPIFVDIKGAPVSLGSGFLVAANNLHFLITAAHVLDESLVAPGGLYFYIGMATKRAINAPVLDRIDVGVALLEDEGVPPYPDIGKQALDLNQLAPLSQPRMRQKYIFLGFPSTKGNANRQSKHVLSASYSYLSSAIDASRYAALGINEDTHIALHFDEKNIRHPDNRRMNFPKPQGISGSPLWELRLPDVGGPKIVGVMIEHHRTEKVLVATDIAFVLQMLRRFIDGGQNEPTIARS